MFEKFFEFVGITNQKKIQSPEQFMENYAGFTFLDGMYRLFKMDDIQKWNGIVGRTFPPAMNRIRVFGYDWQGRIFAVYANTNSVMILEPGTGEAFDTQMDFARFHDVALPQKHDFCLQSASYKEWKACNNGNIEHNQCVGYVIPLFLNGKDEIDNMERSDMEVYWELMMPFINM